MAQNPQDLAIRVQDVHVHYEVLGDNRERFLESARRGFKRHRRVLQRVRALEGVSFELYRGDSLGLLGHNGSGKTTLLQVIAGLISPSAGTVRVSAQPQILGVQAALNPLISGRRNIEMCGLALGLSRREIGELVPSIIEFTDLQEFIDLPVQTYSAGMMQRLSFAISTVTKPDILLIDEALAVGDGRFIEKSLERLREIRRNAGAVVLATHSLGEILSSCNKALWLHEGETQMFGDPETVVAAYRNDDRVVHRKVELMRANAAPSVDDVGEASDSPPVSPWRKRSAVALPILLALIVLGVWLVAADRGTTSGPPAAGTEPSAAERILADLDAPSLWDSATVTNGRAELTSVDGVPYLEVIPEADTQLALQVNDASSMQACSRLSVALTLLDLATEKGVADVAQLFYDPVDDVRGFAEAQSVSLPRQSDPGSVSQLTFAAESATGFEDQLRVDVTQGLAPFAVERVVISCDG